MGQIGLYDSLRDLSVLLTGHRPLPELLTDVACFAVRAVPGADGAGLTLLDGSRPQTVVASAPFVREVDEVQYRLAEGPCVSAVATGRAQVSGSLGGDGRWPHFGPQAGRLGVHSLLSLPLLLPGQVVGALNVYAHAKDAFPDEACRTGELFAGPAAVSVHNAQVLAESQRLAGHLLGALESRAVIDQAMGILMGRNGCTAEEAFAKLRVLSQEQRRPVALVSRGFVDEAVATARGRQGDARSRPS